MNHLDRMRYYYQLGSEKVDFNLKGDLPHIRNSFERLTELVGDTHNAIYGIHTGYGHNVCDMKDPDNWKQDQLLLLNYLKVGVGEPLPNQVVRRALRIQALKVCKGFSGTSPEVFQKLCELSQRKRMPKVPRYGSLGASGDLIPMAHAVAPIFDEVSPTGPRDVISLVNTNSMMASYALENFYRLQEIQKQCVTFMAQATIGVDANMQHFKEEGFAMNPQSEYADVGAMVRAERQKFLNLFEMAENTEISCVQEKYSIRCFPQVMGQICRNLKYTQQIILDEIEQVSDNPLILPNGKAWHGGHFYASGLATAADMMRDACYKLSEVVDRVVLILMDQNLSKGLPNNLQVDSIDHVKGIHQLISALLQRMRGLCLPSNMMSFSCESNNQDIVPCSMNAQNQLHDLLDLTSKVLKAGLFCSERAALIRLEQHIPVRLRLDYWRENHV